VAFVARDLLMRSGEGELRLRVIEVGRHLPVAAVVALLALLPKPALVLISVAERTLARLPEEGPTQVLHLD
jgi:hypothetical protein